MRVLEKTSAKRDTEEVVCLGPDTPAAAKALAGRQVVRSRGEVVSAAVCKTAIRGFDSHRDLNGAQTFYRNESVYCP